MGVYMSVGRSWRDEETALHAARRLNAHACNETGAFVIRRGSKYAPAMELSCSPERLLSKVALCPSVPLRR